MSSRHRPSKIAKTIKSRKAGFDDWISSQTDVALTLSKRILLTESNNADVVFSPLSIQVLLSLIAAGSKGPTLKQLLSFLKTKSSNQLSSFCSELLTEVFTDSSASGGQRLKFANGVWGDQSISFKPSFKKFMDKAYKAAINQVDFRTKVMFMEQPPQDIMEENLQQVRLFNAIERKMK